MNKGNNKNRISELLREIFEDKVLLYTVSILGVSVIGFVLTISTTNPVLKKLNILSIGLIPACLIGMLLDLLIKKKFLEYVKREIEGQFDDAIENFKQKVCEKCRLDDPLNRFGIENITLHREGLERLIRSARERIWISITHYYSLTDLETRLINIIKQKWLDGVEIKILGLDPRYKSAELRSKESKKHAAVIPRIRISGKDVLDTFLDRNEETEKEESKKEAKYVEWRLYDKYPTCCLFLADSKVIYSPLVSHERGKDSIHFQVHEKDDEGKTSELFMQYVRHFDKLFNGAKAKVIRTEKGEMIIDSEISKIFKET